MAQIARTLGERALSTTAVVLERPGHLDIRTAQLAAPGPADVVVTTRWSGISSGTERLLFDGRMPPFPGMNYPLVPGYESVGDVTWAGSDSPVAVGERVFVPGAACYEDLSALFGGAASQLVVPAERVVPVPAALGSSAVLLALAATAWHALTLSDGPDLIIGHGVLGRLLARLAVHRAGQDATALTVWETADARISGAQCYRVCKPEEDARRDYRCIIDASGDGSQLDRLISVLAPGGQIVLAGFYSEPLSFTFPPAFMRELRLQVAAEFRPDDLAAVRDLIDRKAIELGGLVTHELPSASAARAYPRAFTDPDCLKMVLNWEAQA